MICEVKDQDSMFGNLSSVGRHVGCLHGNNLKEYKSKKVLKKKQVKCSWEGHLHSKKCDCFSDDFLAGAKRNHFSVIKQSEKYAE